MKNVFVMLLSIVLMSGSACAEDGGKKNKWNGTIKYSLDYDLPEAYESQRAMLATEMTCYIGKDFTRVEQTSTIGDQITINNLATGVTTVLMDLMGKKIALTTEDVEEDEKVEPVIEYLEETKTIAGYECSKAVYTIQKNGAEAVFEVFYTSELPSEANTQFKGIEGFPMEYVIESQGMVITYSAIEVKEEKVSKSLGKVPDGYEHMTYEEFMEMMGGGQ
ncbi:DUF4412 domain-containing protein [Parvicella tangerina]|uniref:DUF4412 domain-containing protein n=1 Tax=Parvicella tangerina TaxID=2829795 RepID=A0A916JNE8_9FLAO|nr:DUF4412 domain-containing protein [Parvicella tangerina]CAG5083583.1 hypothetical protein CRYO30217_02236 [Parvicella tangerina]